MIFPALGEFVRFLESIGELQRISALVDPRLEVTQIATRALKEAKPAMLFESVEGARFPLAINLFASERRIELALGKHPEQLGEELIGFAERVIPPSLSALWRERRMIRRIALARAKRVGAGIAQEVVAPPNLDHLPIQVCWPGDGGRFITLGQVITYDPADGRRNVGIYRMHVYDRTTTGMHWQIQKGGGFHYHRAGQMGRDLEVAVALGTDPALLIASVAALPEGIDEVMFAAFLRGAPLPTTRGVSIAIDVPAHAEFVLEGVVPQHERKLEGPFGDHFGHYSYAAMFPVFHLKRLTHRRGAIYPATVVGIPPMEDKFLGDATQHILGPLARMLHKEVRDLWAYYEAGFHNLLVVSIDERYSKEAMKAALGLLGTGQLSLTKCLICVSAGVDVRNWRAVLAEIREHFDPHYDFVLLPKVPLDTLDFTSFTMELGSKMIIDATRKDSTGSRLTGRQAGFGSKATELRSERKLGARDLKGMDSRILDGEIVEECLALVKVSGGGRAVVQKLVKRKELRHLKIVAAVSEDVDVRDEENAIWGVFTRFDCERDVLFSHQELLGISPVYKGVMGIDATWKKGYPEPLRMPEDVVRKVDSRWNEYWSYGK